MEGTKTEWVGNEIRIGDCGTEFSVPLSERGLNAPGFMSIQRISEMGRFAIMRYDDGLVISLFLWHLFKVFRQAVSACTASDVRLPNTGLK